jgi:ubiquitin carboxyl-terminal hydrolase 25/28
VDELGDNLGPKTNRNFVDDVIFEVIQRSYDKRDEGSKASAARVIYNPMLAWKDISIMLGMVDYPKSNRSVNVEVEEHPHYAGLGVKGDFDDSLIAFAYNRQRECDPNHSPYYLECLVGVQKGRQSDELLIEVTKADSRGEATETAIENAYKFFDISPETLSGDDYIIGVFRSRIESAPRQAEDAKKCLEIIGKARGSAKIQDEAKTMTVDEAFEALNITTRDVETDSIQAAYVAMVSTSLAAILSTISSF